MSTPKVVLVSGYTKNVAHGYISFYNKRAYAGHNGYEFYNVPDEMFDKSRPPSWSKLHLVKMHFVKGDWVFWSDADSLIMQPKIKLEGFVDNKYDMVLCEDAGRRNIPIKDKIPWVNCGQMLLRNSPWMNTFIETWFKQTKFINTPHWEQDALEDLLLTDKTVLPHIKVLPSAAFNSFVDTYKAGDFMLHFAGQKDITDLMVQKLMDRMYY